MDANKNVKDDYNKIFAVRLRELMEDPAVSPFSRKTTQEELSEALKERGITIKRQTISMYINGRSSPDLEKFKAIADFFGVTYDYLLGKAESKERRFINIPEVTGLTDNSIAALAALQEMVKGDDIKVATIAEVWQMIINSLFIDSKLYKFSESILSYIIAQRDHESDLRETESNKTLFEEAKNAVNNDKFKFYEWRIAESNKEFMIGIADEILNDSSSRKLVEKLIKIINSQREEVKSNNEQKNEER